MMQETNNIKIDQILSFLMLFQDRFQLESFIFFFSLSGSVSFFLNEKLGFLLRKTKDWSLFYKSVIFPSTLTNLFESFTDLCSAPNIMGSSRRLYCIAAWKAWAHRTAFDFTG